MQNLDAVALDKEFLSLCKNPDKLRRAITSRIDFLEVLTPTQRYKLLLDDQSRPIAWPLYLENDEKYLNTFKPDELERLKKYPEIEAWFNFDLYKSFGIPSKSPGHFSKRTQSDLHDYNYSVQIGIVGEPGVGKTSLAYRFVDDDFYEQHTSGIPFLLRSINMPNEKVVRLQIWDTPYKFKQYQTQRHIDWMREAVAVILVFDLTNSESFQAVQKSYDELVKYYQKKEIVLVGTKSDLHESRKITQTEAQAYADHIKVPYMETSAKDNINVDGVFYHLAGNIIRRTETKLLLAAWRKKLTDQQIVKDSLINPQSSSAQFSPKSLYSPPSYQKKADELLALFSNPDKNITDLNTAFTPFFNDYVLNQTCDAKLIRICDTLKAHALASLKKTLSGSNYDKPAKIACLEEALTMPLFTYNWGRRWFADTRQWTGSKELQAMLLKEKNAPMFK